MKLETSTSVPCPYLQVLATETRGGEDLRNPLFVPVEALVQGFSNGATRVLCHKKDGDFNCKMKTGEDRGCHLAAKGLPELVAADIKGQLGVKE